MGYAAGDGCVSLRDIVTCGFTLVLVGNLTGDDAFLSDLAKNLNFSTKLKYDGPAKCRLNVPQIWLKSRPYLALLGKAKEKNLPIDLRIQPRETLEAILSGLFQSDGNVTFYPETGRSNLQFACTSQKLVTQSREITDLLGLKTTFTKTKLEYRNRISRSSYSEARRTLVLKGQKAEQLKLVGTNPGRNSQWKSE